MVCSSNEFLRKEDIIKIKFSNFTKGQLKYSRKGENSMQNEFLIVFARNIFKMCSTYMARHLFVVTLL